MFACTDGANELQDPNHGMLCHAIFLSRDSGAIVCKTAKSKNVAISSTDPEIRSIHTAMIDIIWLRAFLEELSYTQVEPTVIYTDSQPAIDICMSISTDGASKYLVRIINHIKPEIRGGAIQLKWIRTEDNPSDIGTKPLPISLHERHATTLLHGFQLDTIIDGVRTKATVSETLRRGACYNRHICRSLLSFYSYSIHLEYPYISSIRYTEVFPNWVHFLYLPILFFTFIRLQTLQTSRCCSTSWTVFLTYY